MSHVISIKNLNAWFGSKHVLKNIHLSIEPFMITALIGPSGCGKSTFVRCLNRMHEVVPGARMTGEVSVDGENIYAPSVDPVLVRRKIGMVFQRPNPFPTLSIFENVIAGLKLGGGLVKKKAAEVVEKCLRMAALWDEVKDNLHRPGSFLSGGQQQRLCIARCLAVRPEVVLMDEPASSLDPIATQAIEALIRELSNDVTIVIVTHNMQQAQRVASYAAVLMSDERRVGELIEYGPVDQIFGSPRDHRTEAYVTGRIG